MSDVTQGVKQGVGCGLLAGAAFAIAQVVAGVVAGDPAVLTLRRFASVLLGPAALDATPTSTAILVGLIGHLYLSAMYGLCYGVYNAILTVDTRGSSRRQAVLGPLFGAVLWLANTQVFARALYPWLLVLPRAPQIFLHAVGFGLPLGLLCAVAERRALADLGAPLPVAIVRRPAAAASRHAAIH
jgi:hypothetical protein